MFSWASCKDLQRTYPIVTFSLALALENELGIVKNFLSCPFNSLHLHNTSKFRQSATELNADLNFETTFLFGIKLNRAGLEPNGCKRLCRPERCHDCMLQTAPALAPFVGKEMEISATGKNEVATFLPVTFHHVTAFVEPSLLHDLNSDGVRRENADKREWGTKIASVLHDSPKTTASVGNSSFAASTAVAQDWRSVKPQAENSHAE